MDEISDFGLAEQCTNTTKWLSTLTGIAGGLIILFMFTPLNNIIFPAVLGRVVIILLLMYIIYANVLHTSFCKRVFDVDFMQLDFNEAKMNIIYGHIFTLLLTFLLYSIFNSLYSVVSSKNTSTSTYSQPSSTSQYY